MASLTADQLDDLQAFLKDWLRHCGRTQADLRRALHAASIRMPVLVEELVRIHDTEGLPSLAARLCGIEALWQNEDDGDEDPMESVQDSFSQLDMLLQEIRADGPLET
jgi:hypothetical protein